MTTRVHIVNFGPDIVAVTKITLAGPHPSQAIQPQGSLDEYIYEDQDLLLKEVKLPVAENTKQAPERQPRETDEPTQ